MASHKSRFVKEKSLKSVHPGPFEEGKKEKRRKDISGKVGKEISDRRDEQVICISISPVVIMAFTVQGITQRI